MFEIKSIASGSSGNSYLLKTAKETLIIECGVSYAKIIAGLNFRIKDVAGCLVSHEHNDHSSSIRNVLKAGINVFTSKGTIESLAVEHHRIKVIESGKQFSTGGFTILPFSTQHDAKEPLGFLIHHEEFGKLLFATDTYYIHYKFSGLNYIMIECNYCREIVNDNLQKGVVDKMQVKRLLKSHFSLENVKGFMKTNNLSDVRKIFLIHLSNRNSNAELFKIEIEKLTGIPVLVY